MNRSNFKNFPGQWHQISRTFPSLHWFPELSRALEKVERFQNFQKLSRKRGNQVNCFLKRRRNTDLLRMWSAQPSDDTAMAMYAARRTRGSLLCSAGFTCRICAYSSATTAQTVKTYHFKPVCKNDTAYTTAAPALACARPKATDKKANRFIQKCQKKV